MDFDVLKGQIRTAVECDCCTIDEVVLNDLTVYIRRNYEKAESPLTPSDVAKMDKDKLAELYEFGKYLLYVHKEYPDAGTAVSR